MEPALLVGRQKFMRGAVAVGALILVSYACSGPESQGTPERSASRESAMARTAAPGAASGETLTTPAARDVLGPWRVVRVEGKKPPRNAIPGISMGRSGHEFWLAWRDGLNEHSLRWRLTPDGQYHIGVPVSTAVGCIGNNCTRPSGFGVTDATAMRVTRDGRLVFLDKDGVELARYRRPGLMATWPNGILR
jgi:hypothetical protein